jgi:fidgetin-like protein 1
VFSPYGLERSNPYTFIQGNESEALRSWKSALDQINYYKAYKISSNYSPKSETERALYDSLRELEMQCKERVDLLETLKKSREELGIDAHKEATPEHRSGKTNTSGHGNGGGSGSGSGSGKDGRRRLGKSKAPNSPATTPKPEQHGSWLGGETVPPMQMSELPHATPALPPRPTLAATRSSEISASERTSPISRVRSTPLGFPPTLPVPATKASRSPSPDHGRKPMRTTLRPERRGFMKYRSTSNKDRRSETMKAAGLAWDSQPRKNSYPQRPDSDPTIEARLSATAARRSIDHDATRYEEQRKSNASSLLSVPDYAQPPSYREVSSATTLPTTSSVNKSLESLKLTSESAPSLIDLDSEPDGPPPIPPQHIQPMVKTRPKSPLALPKAPEITYRREYPPRPHNVPQPLARNILEKAYTKPSASENTPGITRKPVAPVQTAVENRGRSPAKPSVQSDSEEDVLKRSTDRARRPKGVRAPSANTITPPSTDGESQEEDGTSAEEKRMNETLKNLPRGLDENAAKQILNEIVVKGDEVHWEDVAGLSAAKKALKEAVVYPFLRPDLFMGLREPARGMLLFGPPGTGKTMLARAVATESKSTFFAISASSLTSKWHGESEKLVRALFALAKALAPSIIFVDEIDSLLSARSGSSEHEASRRSKTEFLIQWSDLQRAAAGKDTTVGDASRVLVLAATNCPWDIDDAARRRFVRRQYIPLPEAETRDTQVRTLLGHQKHDLSEEDIGRLVELTDGKSA